ncbi:MAG: Protein RecA, partial [Parcubacteria group bacterium GW2011_GWC1_39_29]
TKSGSWFNYGEVRLGQGIEGSRQFIKENPKVEKEIVAKIIAAAAKENLA